MSLPVRSNRADGRGVAEGVETEEQLRFLLGKGCRLFQGYHFSHPQPAEDFEGLLRKPTK